VLSHSDVDVLVVGDANPDLVVRGDVVPRFGQAEQLLDGADLVLGGSAAIVAHGLARLGRATRLVAAAGDDAFGHLIEGLLRDAGVDADLVRDSAGTGVTIVLSAPHDRAVLTFPGAIPALTAEQVGTALEQALLDGVRHVHAASFFLLPALVPGLPTLLARARAAGVTTSMDTNFDPAERWEGVAEVLPHLDLLLPNRAEVLALAGAVGTTTDDSVEAARALAACGPVVVVKEGSDGALRVAPDGSVLHEQAMPVTPVDTTGAGDTFDAAYLDALLHGLEPSECLRRGCRAGALSTSAVGGTAAQPTLSQLTGAVDARHA
jgi:ribokinase